MVCVAPALDVNSTEGWSTKSRKKRGVWQIMTAADHRDSAKQLNTVKSRHKRQSSGGLEDVQVAIGFILDAIEDYLDIFNAVDPQLRDLASQLVVLEPPTIKGWSDILDIDPKEENTTLLIKVKRTLKYVL